MKSFNAADARKDFPILKQSVNGKPLCFLDSAASAQKPLAVVEAMKNFYLEDYANVHRGAYYLSDKATRAYEGAREKVRAFLNAAETSEIIFTRGATESINLVASTFSEAFLKAGDEILISGMEHHSNIVPWQMACQRKGARLRVIPLNRKGELEIEQLDTLIGPNTRLMALTHVSNALGTINPIADIIARAHARSVPVLVDGAQAVPHMTVDVARLDCDFYVFSSHKIYGPTGIGVLYGKKEWLTKLPPYQGGGDMIKSVTFENTIYNDLPYKFEAGTPHIAGAVGLGAAIDYVSALDRAGIAQHEQNLLKEATTRLAEIGGLKIIGTAHDKTGVISFTLEDVHPHDMATILDSEGIAIRAGHHCAQPVMDFFKVPATARVSLGLYNTKADIERLMAGLQKVKEIFG